MVPPCAPSFGSRDEPRSRSGENAVSPPRAGRSTNEEYAYLATRRIRSARTLRSVAAYPPG
jgi:hypothetical protein